MHFIHFCSVKKETDTIYFVHYNYMEGIDIKLSFAASKCLSEQDTLEFLLLQKLNFCASMVHNST